MSNLRIVSFTYPGPLVPKPRMTQRDKRSPSKTMRPAVALWWSYVDALSIIAMHGGLKQGEQIFEASFTAWLPMAKSWSKKKKELYRGSPHLQRPDIDNLMKGVLDALAHNDATVWRLPKEPRKYWDDGMGSRAEISLWVSDEKNPYI